MTDVLGRRGFSDLLADRRNLLDAPHYRAQVEAIADAIVSALRAGNKVLWCGNGGSAAEAQHMAAELSGRFLRERPGLYSEALSVNSLVKASRSQPMMSASGASSSTHISTRPRWSRYLLS